MFIVFPIGLLVFSLVADIVYRVGGSYNWAMAAWYTMGVGVLGGLAAAIPGLVDLLSLGPSRARTIGIWHMSLNLAVVALFAINFFIRPSVGHGAVGPFIMSIIGIATVVVSGWLGGTLVYVHGIGVEPQQRGETGAGQSRRAA